MGFITINEGFICEVCGAVVPSAKSTCRNHCTNCLASKHVDENKPGDRSSLCGGIMKAIAVEGSDPDKLDLVHECTVCGKIQRNKTAQDDSLESLLKLMQLGLVS